MTPENKIKLTILKNFLSGNEFIILISKDQPNYSGEFNELIEEYIDDYYDEYSDMKNYELRQGEVETNLQPEYDRHYESKSVAAKMFDGSWVGWTYWFGGGKYGEPESVDWMGSAYDLTCKEEQKMVAVQTFEKRS